MYFTKISLKNYKCFEDTDIVFHEKLNVILGANGAGKTSVLEAIALSMSAMFRSMDGVKTIMIDKSRAHLKAFQIGSTSDVQAQYPVTVSAAAVQDGQELTWERSLNTAKGTTTYGNAKDMIDLGNQYLERLRCGDTDLVLPVLAYYGTGRLWDYHREKTNDIFESNTRVNGYLDCFDGTANLKLMMNWFAKMTVQKYQNQELGLGPIPELEAVLSAMESCYKRITGCNDVRIQYNLGTKELDVLYPDESGNRMRIPLNLLSDGYKSTISLVADIAYRMAVLNPQLLGNVCAETDGIILIDEIDLHLHPAWQERIIGDLTSIFPKVQFIVTTHAPAVINTIHSENLIILDNQQADYPTEEVYGKDVNTILQGTMLANERPEPIKKKFEAFYHFMTHRKYAEASAVLDELEVLLHHADADIAACRLKLKLQRYVGGMQ